MLKSEVFCRYELEMRGLEDPRAGRRWDIGFVDWVVGLFSRCWDGGCLEDGYLQEKDARLMTVRKEVDLRFAFYAAS